MPRYFSFNYNFFGQNRQEGVLLLEAMLCMSILFVCGLALLHLHAACILRLQESAHKLHVLACAREHVYRSQSASCQRGCRIDRTEYTQEGVTWTVVHNHLKGVTVTLVSIAPAHTGG